MKIERLISAHKNKSPIACFFGLFVILLILSLSIEVTHCFAKDKKISGRVRTSSGDEISGVTIAFSNGEGSTTTDSSGEYEQKVKEGWSGTATPSKVGYNFDPASRNYSNVEEDQKKQDYTGTLQMTISGYVRTSTGSGINEVTITFTNDGGTVNTDSSGYYDHEVAYGWSGSVTPTKEGYSFIPVFRNYNNVTTDQLNQDYTGRLQTRIIAGYVRTPTGSGINGAIITFSNGGGTVNTDSSGNYINKVTYGWSGTVTPTKEGYSFDPASRSYSNITSNQSDQDYTGRLQTRTISGYVRASAGIGINEATIIFTNGGGTVITDSSGYYNHEVAYGWSGTVTPTKEGYSFDPASRSYSNITSNQSDQDYTGTLQTRTISGYVRTSTGSGINEATIPFTNGGGTRITDSSGYYNHEVAYGWSGSVTPTKEGYSFIPVFRNYNNVTTDQLNQDYTGIENSELLSITINIIGSGNVELDPDKEVYSAGSPITLTGIADSGWVFSGWSGDLNTPDNPVSMTISSDMTITVIFLEDFDNDGVSDKEENSGPNGGDGNNDNILDSLQSNVSFLVLENKMDYVAIETPHGTSIKNCKTVIDPPNSNYPADVEFLYGFFTFNIEDINIGGATLVTFYFPDGFSSNTYSKYGPTPEDPNDHWYEFIFDGMTGAEIDESNITLHFVDGKRGDDDLTENGIIIDIGGPGIKTAILSENDSNPFDGGHDSYSCFVECLLQLVVMNNNKER